MFSIPGSNCHVYRIVSTNKTSWTSLCELLEERSKTSVTYSFYHFEHRRHVCLHFYRGRSLSCMFRAPSYACTATPSLLMDKTLIAIRLPYLQQSRIGTRRLASFERSRISAWRLPFPAAYLCCTCTTHASRRARVAQVRLLVRAARPELSEPKPAQQCPTINSRA